MRDLILKRLAKILSPYLPKPPIIYVPCYPEMIEQRVFEHSLDVVAAAKDLIYELNQDAYDDIPLPDEVNFLQDAIHKFEDYTKAG